MGQAVSGHAVMLEMWVQSRASPCGVYGGQSGIGTVFFSLSFSVLSCQHCSTCAQHSFIHSFTYTMLTVESNAQ
jgi:hypothetical protein